MSYDERQANRQRKLNGKALFKAYRKGRAISGISSADLQAALSRISKHSRI